MSLFYKLLTALRNRYEISYVYHDNWAHSSGELHNSRPPVFVSIDVWLYLWQGWLVIYVSASKKNCWSSRFICGTGTVNRVQAYSLFSRYGNLALQVEGVSDEKVNYGYEFWVTRAIESLHCKLQTRPLIREGAPEIQDRKFQTTIFRQEIISGRKAHKGTGYQDILTDCQS
jgi:hypothetical protein